MRIGAIRETHVEWMKATHRHMGERPEAVQLSWKKAGLRDAMDTVVTVDPGQQDPGQQ
jgi:hypothetical protein